MAHTDLVLLTHLHIDHAAELPGLFKARAVSAGEPIVFTVWGPAGSEAHPPGAYFPSTTRFLDLLFGPQGAFAYLSAFAAPITIQAHDIALEPPGPHVIWSERGLIIRSAAGHHGDAPAVIYRVDYAGKSMTFSGDIDAAGLASLRQIAHGSDLLVFNSVVLDPPGSPSVLYTLHSPPRAIGEVAAQAGVRAILLSHLSPAVEAMHDEVLASIHRGFTGPVSFAHDGLKVQP